MRRFAREVRRGDREGVLADRGMSRRATAEMAAVMPILAIALLALGWLALVPEGELALVEHGLMMPAMLVPMVFRLDLCTGRSGHTGHHGDGRR
jgi:hypothetical protein